jgi:hypothetical protein
LRPAAAASPSGSKGWTGSPVWPKASGSTAFLALRLRASTSFAPRVAETGTGPSAQPGEFFSPGSRDQWPEPGSRGGHGRGLHTVFNADGRHVGLGRVSEVTR